LLISQEIKEKCRAAMMRLELDNFMDDYEYARLAFGGSYDEGTKKLCLKLLD